MTQRKRMSHQTIRDVRMNWKTIKVLRIIWNKRRAPCFCKRCETRKLAIIDHTRIDKIKLIIKTIRLWTKLLSIKLLDNVVHGTQDFSRTTQTFWTTLSKTYLATRKGIKNIQWKQEANFLKSKLNILTVSLAVRFRSKKITYKSPGYWRSITWKRKLKIVRANMLSINQLSWQLLNHSSDLWRLGRFTREDLLLWSQ